MRGNVLVADQVLERIIDLIRARPTITVKELANELGFAEERSVYYWLRKAGHRGLKTLKRDVLWSQRANGNPAGPGHEPGDRPAGEAKAPGVREARQAYGPFSLVVSTRSYEPWIKAGDELHVDPKASPADGDLVVVDLPGEPDALRRAYPAPPGMRLVHPSDPREACCVDATPGTIRGVVVRLVRGRP